MRQAEFHSETLTPSKPLSTRAMKDGYKKKRTIARGSKRGIKSAQRAMRALELRKGGLSYQTIADMLGYSEVSGAYRAVMRGLKFIVEEPGEHVRTIELSRLDDVITAHYVNMRQGNEKSAGIVMKAIDMRARIMGMYDFAPKITLNTQINVTDQRQSVSIKLAADEDALTQYMKQLMPPTIEAQQAAPHTLRGGNNGNGMGGSNGNGSNGTSH